jgi:phage/plasmid-like protein (TIGR03299 family)
MKANKTEQMAVIGGSPYASSLSDTNDTSVWAEEAGLNWDIKSSPVYYDVGLLDAKGLPLMKQDAKRQVLYRSDNNEKLSIVGKDFKVVQPRAVLDFYAEISKKMGVNLESAGCTKGGALIWGSADIGQEIRIKGQDLVQNRLMFSTANDGTKATTVHFVSKRIVCNNMLNYAFNQANSSPFYVRIPHMIEITPERTKRMIEEIINGQGEHWKNFEESANNMADTKMNLKQATEFFVELYSKMSRRNGELELPKTNETKIPRLMQVFESGVGQNTKSAQNTLWGAVNAVTRFIDHETRYHNASSQVYVTQFATGNAIKNRAFTIANEMIKAA